MPQSVLVTGGTGTLGKQVVARLLAGGNEVRVLSRQPRSGNAQFVVGDLRRDTGVQAAVDGVDVIVHCASAQRGDVESARNLLAALANTDATHLVYISIVGVERVPFGYYKAKLDVENQIVGCGIPWTILRTTQFHDLLVGLFRAQRRVPVLTVPARTSFQPIASREVAQRLVELVAAGPAGRVPDMGGPEIRPVVELARSYQRAVGQRRPIASVWVPGKAGKGFRSGGQLAPESLAGQGTFDQFVQVLAARRPR